MIITLKGANFADSNIGTLSTWRISTILGDGATYNGVTDVDKDPVTGLNATVTIAEGYEIGAAGVTVTMGGVGQAYTVVDNVITINIAEVTGNVVIKVPTVNTATGEEDVIPSYTFIINPTPADATVTLSATGYSDVSGTGSQSITVANGTEVNWSVNADGYTTRTGTWTISGGNKTENITLSTPTVVGTMGGTLVTSGNLAGAYLAEQTTFASQNYADGGTSNTEYFLYDLIPVEPSTTYYISHSRACFKLDSSGQQTGTRVNLSNQENKITTSSTTAYLCIGFKYADAAPADIVINKVTA